MISKWEDQENRGYWSGNLTIFRTKLGLKSQRSRKLLTKISQRFKLDLSWISPQSFQLYLPNWQKLQETRGGKREAKNVEVAGEGRREKIRSKEVEKKEKEINILRGGSKDPTPASQIRSCFLEAYQKEFGKEYPGWGAKEFGQAASWLRSVPLQKALDYCRLYPQWNDPWVSKQGHPFGILVAQYVKLDAWNDRPQQLVDKMVLGRAREKVLGEQKRTLVEMRMHGEIQEQQNRDRAIGGQVPKNVSHEPKFELPEFGSELDNDPLDIEAG